MSTQVRITAGMAVVDREGKPVGTVKAVRELDFLLDRKLKRDTYVPFDAVKGIREDQVMLRATASGIDELGWKHPPLTS